MFFEFTPQIRVKTVDISHFQVAHFFMIKNLPRVIEKLLIHNNLLMDRSLSDCPQVLLPTLWISDETHHKTVAMYGVAHSAYKTGSCQSCLMSYKKHSKASKFHLLVCVPNLMQFR